MLSTTYIQVRKTARAIEVLTYRVDGQVAAIEETVRSGWVRISQAVIGLLGRWLCKN